MSNCDNPTVMGHLPRDRNHTILTSTECETVWFESLGDIGMVSFDPSGDVPLQVGYRRNDINLNIIKHDLKCFKEDQCAKPAIANP